MIKWEQIEEEAFGIAAAEVVGWCRWEREASSSSHRRLSI